LPEYEHHGRFDSGRIGAALEIARRQVEPILRGHACFADREDVVSLALERAWTSRERLRNDERFAGWVAKIARNAAYDWLRARRVAAPLDVLENLRDSTTPERELERARIRRALNLALAELPEAQREIWILREIEGLSYEEIAMIRGIVANTVGPALTAARSRLIRELILLGMRP
jgi:RNA polymerase sigma-70 factor (ECF subfamily)